MKKKLKRMVVLVLCLSLTGAALTGCGGNEQSRQDAQPEVSQSTLQETGQDTVGDEAETEIETEAAEKSEENTETYEDNFAVDSEAAKEFAGKVKAAAGKKDLEALAELTAFPVYVGLPDVDVVETREDFLKLGAETIFTEGLLQSVEQADIDNLQPSMAGFSISDGGTANINFGVVDGALAINGINY